ncbi:MAG: response regulator transcription factor [Chitinophagaceae bacterium]|nr:MAG: response regulator transcription factor [Chitinophagaceae bacterium]
MIDKVIIAEDHESANLSIQKTMEECNIPHIDYAYYCDDALGKIQLAASKGSPYDLLITDLYFEADGTHQKIGGGFDLVKAVRAVQPAISILIFSAEQRPATIDMLFNKYEIDGYVRKARHDAKELKAAVQQLSRGERYYPRTLSDLVKQSNSYEFTELDINIIRLLSQGYQQKEIPAWLVQHGIKPNSLSIIEKRLKQIRDELEFTKNEQLVLFCKEAGVL